MESKEYYEQLNESRREELRAQISEADLIYIDSCSLMDAYMPLLAENLIPILESQKKKLTVIENVLGELKHLMRPTNDPKKLSREIYAYLGLYCLRAFTNKDEARGYSILDYQYVPDEIKGGHADAAFEAVLGMKSITNRIIVITQDKKLTEAVLRLNESGATTRKPIKVYRISHEEAPGFLVSRKKAKSDFRVAVQKKPQPQQSTRRVVPQHKPQQSQPQAPTVRTQKGQAQQVTSDQLKTADAVNYVKDTSLHVPSGYKAISRIQLPEITAAYLPETVTTLMPQAFIDCSKLMRIALPKSLVSIEESAFQRCVSLHSVTIPQNVKRIDSAAFKDCSALSSITLCNGLRELGSSVFANCISLSSITVPAGVAHIETMAFKGCRALSSVSLSEGLETIAALAFSNCVSLTSITIPDSVREIARTAFAACPSLVICCNNGSYAHKFALECGLKFKLLS